MQLLICAWLIAFGLSVVPAHADPISGLIVAGLLGPAAAGTAVGGLLTSAVTLGLSLGASYLANALFGPSQPNPTPQTVQNTVRQSIPPRWRHYGRQKIGGALMLIESKNGDLHQVIAFANHKINTINEFRLDNRPCTIGSLDGDGWVTLEDYPANTVRIKYRLGEATQTHYSELTDALGSDIWSSAHKGNGIAHAYLLTKGVEAEKFTEVYPNRIAQLQMICEGALVYDPRLDDTVFSTNLALIMRDYLTHQDGCGIDPADLDEESFIQAADDCDALLPKKGGGTVGRYQGALSYSLDAERASVIKRILTACDGDLRLLPSGKIGFSVGVWREPTVHIADADIIDWEGADGGGPLQEFNLIRLKYTEPLADFAAGEAQAWRDETDISASGEERTQTLEVYEVQHHNHARRLMKIASRRASPRHYLTLRTTLRGMEAWDQRWIYVTLADLDIAEQTFEVRSISLDVATMSVTMKVASFGPEAYEFDAETEEGTAPSVPVEVVDDGIPDPEDVIATTTSRDTGYGDKIAVVVLSWDDPGRSDLKAQAQYSIADADEWIELPVADASNKAEAVGLNPGTAYDFRVRFRAVSGSVSDWVEVEDVVPDADVPPPEPMLSASLDVDSDDVTVSWRPPNIPNYTGAKVYRGTTSSFGSATLIDTRYTSNSYLDEDLLPDTYWYWVTALNGTAESSEVSAGPSVTIS